MFHAGHASSTGDLSIQRRVETGGLIALSYALQSGSHISWG